MRALRFEDKNLTVGEIPLPSRADEALIRVLRSGICNTDIEIVRGYSGFQGTIGHEFIGVVEESHGSEHLIGKRVVGEINAGCGDCDKCQGNDSRHCANRTVLGIVNRDGAHAEFLNLPSRNLMVVPDGISDQQAVFVEPLAAAVGITEQVKVLPETKVAVIGDGKLGNLCAQSLGLKSRSVVLIGKHPDKLKLVAGRDIEGVLLDDAPKLRRDFDVVVEASGSESGFSLALDLLRPRGKLVLKSTFQGSPRWEAWRVVVNEITIVGSRCGRFGPALELLKTGSIDLENLISDEFDLRDGLAAFARAQQDGVMKVLLRNG